MKILFQEYGMLLMACMATIGMSGLLFTLIFKAGILQQMIQYWILAAC